MELDFVLLFRGSEADLWIFFNSCFLLKSLFQYFTNSSSFILLLYWKTFLINYFIYWLKAIISFGHTTNILNIIPPIFCPTCNIQYLKLTVFFSLTHDCYLQIYCISFYLVCKYGVIKITKTKKLQKTKGKCSDKTGLCITRYEKCYINKD